MWPDFQNLYYYNLFIFDLNQPHELLLNLLLYFQNGTMLFLDPKDWTLSGVNNFLLPHLFPSWSTEEMPSSILASSENDENSLASLIDEGDEIIR